MSCTSSRLPILLFYRRVFWPFERPFKAAMILGGFFHPLLSYYRLGCHGQCLPASVLLLDAIQWSRGEMCQHQRVLPCHGCHQHGERLRHSDHPLPSNSQAANEPAQKARNMWHYGCGNLVSVLLITLHAPYEANNHQRLRLQHSPYLLPLRIHERRRRHLAHGLGVHLVNHRARSRKSSAPASLTSHPSPASPTDQSLQASTRRSTPPSRRENRVLEGAPSSATAAQPSTMG